MSWYSMNKSNQIKMGKLQKQHKQTLTTSAQYLTADMVKISRATKLTVQSASNGVQISKLKKDNGEKVLIEHVVVMLLQLKSFVKIGADDEMLFDWAEIIITEYWYMKLEEILLAIYKGSRQKQYGDVLLSNVLSWLDDYDKRKTDHHEHESLKTKEGFDPREPSEEPKHIGLTESDLFKLGHFKKSE